MRKRNNESPAPREPRAPFSSSAKKKALTTKIPVPSGRRQVARNRSDQNLEEPRAVKRSTPTSEKKAKPTSEELALKQTLEYQIASHRRKIAQLEDTIRSVMSEPSSDEEPEESVRKFDLLDYSRALSDYNEYLTRSNKEAEVILSDLKKLAANGQESRTVAFTNTQIKKDKRDLRKLINKCQEDFRFLNDQRESQSTVDSKAKPNDIAYANNAVRIETAAFEEQIQEFETAISTTELQISQLEDELSKRKSPQQQALQDEINRQSKILEQIQRVVGDVHVDPIPPELAEHIKVEYNKDVADEYQNLEDARKVYAMTQALGMEKQKQLLDLLERLESMRANHDRNKDKLHEIFDEELEIHLKSRLSESAAIQATLLQIEQFADDLTRSAFGQTVTGTALSKLRALRQLINV